MKVIEQLERLRIINAWISAECTGSPDEFAQVLNISRRCLYEYIAFMKDLGIEVQYSKQRRTFYSANTKELRISYSIQVLSKKEASKINAGFIKKNFQRAFFVHGTPLFWL